MSSNQSAPFKKDPLFNRESFLRPPDWRWQEAKKIQLQKSTGIPVINVVDPLVLYAVRLQEAFLQPSVRQFVCYKMPDAWQVVQLGVADMNSIMKACLQACIISGLDQQQTCNKLQWIKPIQVMLYRDLFCDLSGAEGVPAWFQQMMLHPLRSTKNMALFRARALAYYHSLDAALKSLNFGIIGRTAKDVMQKMWRCQRNKQIFDYYAKQTNIPIQIYATNIQQAVRGREQRDFIKESKQGQGSQTAILQIGKMLESSIRGFTQAETKLDTQNAKFGIDFSAQYIKHIKSKNGQKA